MMRTILVIAGLLGSVQMAQACLSPGEEIFDPGEYVARFYDCDSLADVGELALGDRLLARWHHAVDNNLIDQPFVIMGNDYDLTELSVLEHAVRTTSDQSLEIVIRASFRNFGEQQVIDWVFQDDPSDDLPSLLVDIRGVAPHTYSMADMLPPAGK